MRFGIFRKFYVFYVDFERENLKQTFPLRIHIKKYKSGNSWIFFGNWTGTFLGCDVWFFGNFIFLCGFWEGNFVCLYDKWCTSNREWTPGVSVWQMMHSESRMDARVQQYDKWYNPNRESMHACTMYPYSRFRLHNLTYIYILVPGKATTHEWCGGAFDALTYLTHHTVIWLRMN